MLHPLLLRFTLYPNKLKFPSCTTNCPLSSLFLSLTRSGKGPRANIPRSNLLPQRCVRPPLPSHLLLLPLLPGVHGGGAGWRSQMSILIKMMSEHKESYQENWSRGLVSGNIGDKKISISFKQLLYLASEFLWLMAQWKQKEHSILLRNFTILFFRLNFFKDILF